MAICKIHRARITQEQYDAVRRGAMPDNQLPDGMLFHVVGPVPDGWCVIEVWESQDAAARFSRDTLQP